ncbi:MAG TPA: 16S rRNA (cytosine(967)-C(5))-methyltransferase, partial [Cellvibrio sp.]|nr:16S rRNA (cytosine(967)-C(5))-methyltransferase [Cellvibrio sp.]
CSIMPAENTQVVEAFLARQPDAVCDLLDEPWGIAQPCGRQLLPGIGGHDGFYYARLCKPV